jgi:hypothetical protein
MEEATDNKCGHTRFTDLGITNADPRRIMAVSSLSGTLEAIYLFSYFTRRRREAERIATERRNAEFIASRPGSGNLQR